MEYQLRGGTVERDSEKEEGRKGESGRVFRERCEKIVSLNPVFFSLKFFVFLSHYSVNFSSQNKTGNLE